MQKKMQIKTTVRCHITPTRMVTVKRHIMSSAGKDAGQRERGGMLREEHKMRSCWRTAWQFFKNVNAQLSHDHSDSVPRHVCKKR